MFRSIALAALLVAGAASTGHAAETLRVCTASKTGNYYAFAATLQRVLAGSVVVEPVATEGSWANLTALKRGDCDAAIVQSDADFVYRSSNSGANFPAQRVGAVFQETLNMVCNARLDIEDMGDLIAKRPKVAIGKAGSGSWVSWTGLVTADRIEGGDEYTAIPTSESSGALALTQVVDGSDVGCMFWTMSANSDFINNVKAVAEGGKVLNFVEIADKDFNDTLDARGQSIYTPVSVQYGKGGWFGDSEVASLGVQALFYVSNAWMSEHDDEFNTLVQAFLPTVGNFKAERKLN